MPARRLRERGRIARVHHPQRPAFPHPLYAAGREHDDTQPDRLARWRNVEPETAELLGVLIRTKRARRVLEIGTSNGYSTIWLADAAAATGGTVLTVEIEPSRTALARENLARAGLEDRVELRTEDAAQTLRGPPRRRLRADVPRRRAPGLRRLLARPRPHARAGRPARRGQ